MILCRKSFPIFQGEIRPLYVLNDFWAIIWICLNKNPALFSKIILLEVAAVSVVYEQYAFIVRKWLCHSWQLKSTRDIY